MGATVAANAATNNRLLHSDEKTLAQIIAANSKGKYTLQQVEDAMRASGNSELGENVMTGVVIPVNTNTSAKSLYDSNSMTLTSDGSGNFSLVQSIASHVDPGLAQTIIDSTGGSKSPYSWSDTTLGKMVPNQSDTSVNPFTSNANGCLTVSAKLTPPIPY